MSVRPGNGATMSDLKLYILGFPREFRGNHWKREIEESAVDLGWNVVHEAAQAANPEEVLRQAKDADLFLWLRTHNNDPHGDAYAMLRRIEDAGVPTVGMHMDLYWDLPQREPLDRKSTRLNSSHVEISYAVFCLKKKNSEYLNSVSARHKML